MDVKANLYPCAHCERTGTCARATNGASCAACVKANELKGKDLIGLPCGTCGGLGNAEPKTERINKRMQPILAVFTVYFLLSGVFLSAFFKSQHFNEIMAFSAPLVGVILAFYFTARTSQRS